MKFTVVIIINIIRIISIFFPAVFCPSISENYTKTKYDNSLKVLIAAISKRNGNSKSMETNFMFISILYIY